MGDTLRISGIIDESIVDGKGLRYTIFHTRLPLITVKDAIILIPNDFGGRRKKRLLLFMKKFVKSFAKWCYFCGGEPFVNLLH